MRIESHLNTITLTYAGVDVLNSCVYNYSIVRGRVATEEQLELYVNKEKA